LAGSLSDLCCLKRHAVQAAKVAPFVAGNKADVRLIQMDEAAAGQFFQ
jgi:hypothetical protein